MKAGEMDSRAPLVEARGMASLPGGASSRREDLRDGVPEVRRDESVSSGKIRAIASVRTMVLCLVLAGSAAALVPLWPVQISESITESAVTLFLDLCAPHGPNITGSGADPQGFLGVVRQGQVHMMHFNPVGDRAKRLGLPPLIYAQSEEVFVGGPERLLGLSLGTFSASSVRFQVEVAAAPEGKTHESCVRNRSERWGLRGKETVHLFGSAVADVLKRAGRRIPQDWVMTTPQVHGALLLWVGGGGEGHDRVWSNAAGMFGEPYGPSTSWSVFRTTVTLLRIVSCMAILVLAGSLLYKTWEEKLAIWMVQYDYLWEEVVKDSQIACHHKDRSQCDLDDPKCQERRELDELGRRRELAQLEKTFQSKYQACSLFFILDHIVGDPQGNSEDWAKGIMTAFLHAFAFALLPVLPVVQGLFFSKLKLWTTLLSGLCVVAVMAFGGMYYFAVPFRTRRVFFWLHAALAICTFLWAFYYLVSVVLFLVTRVVVEPQQTVKYAATLATAVLYVVVVSSQLNDLRKQFESKLKGQNSKGHVIKFLRFLGLDTKTIVFEVVCGFVLILLLSGMLMLVVQLYTPKTAIMDIVPAIVTPFTTLAATLQLIRNKQKGVEEAIAGVLDKVDDIL